MHHRALGLTIALVLAVAPPGVQAMGAQQQDSSVLERRDRPLPLEVAREAARLYNAASGLRITGSHGIPADRVITGDVAVLDGSVTVAGQVTGRITVMNGDLRLAPGARVGGDVLVVGGRLEGETVAYVGGEIRTWPQPFLYHHEGEQIVAEQGEPGDERRARRSRARRFASGPVKFQIGSLGVYNRVEGLPIYVGPSVRAEGARGRLTLRAHGVMRTADDLALTGEKAGHRVDLEVRVGRRGGIAFSGGLYDIVDDVEDWQLSDLETGLASFFLHRDFRDYYNRHGGGGSIALFVGEQADITLSLKDERWRAREERDPFTLFRNGQRWRTNPVMDQGKFHIANATLRIDTRNDVNNPWAGWYIIADVERGSGNVEQFAPTTTLREAPTELVYRRGFLDLRRYNRVGPGSQLNARMVLGGWIGGDALPLQRRFSLGGPGSMPGFDFREPYERDDRGTCTPSGASLPGTPAECDRLALVQLEFRRDVRFGFPSSGDWWRWRIDTDGQWIVFADAGRGWLVGPRRTSLSYPSDQAPPPGTFRADAGFGFDFGLIGLYVAKALSEPHAPVNIFARVHHRF